MDVKDLKAGYHQFGNKGDVWANCTHIAKDGFNPDTLCGTPMLSHNYAANEMHSEINCPKCLAIYNTPEKTEKDKLIEDLEYLSDEQCKELRILLNFVSSHSSIGKGKLMKYVYGEHYSGIDSALPEPWVKKVQDIHSTFNTSFHCMNYNTKSFGEVENIAELFVVNLFKTFE